jgi:tetratricopeptide (TPR) repeat protein
MKDEADCWFKKGIDLGNQGKYDEAIKCFDEVLRIDASYPDAWYAKGIACFGQKKYEESLKSFDIAIERNPSDLMALDRRSRTLRALGRDVEEDAVFIKDNAISHHPRISVEEPKAKPWWKIW